jgi:hypothetical protein
MVVVNEERPSIQTMILGRMFLGYGEHSPPTMLRHTGRVSGVNIRVCLWVDLGVRNGNAHEKTIGLPNRVLGVSGVSGISTYG